MVGLASAASLSMLPIYTEDDKCEVECAYPNLILPTLSVVADHPVWQRTILIAHGVLQAQPGAA